MAVELDAQVALDGNIVWDGRSQDKIELIIDIIEVNH